MSYLFDKLAGLAARQRNARASNAESQRSSTLPSSPQLAALLSRLNRQFDGAPPKTDTISDPARSKIHAVIASCRGAFIGLGVFSGMSNILMLTGSFFMLQVYDRVLPSRSVPTLIGLGVLAVMLFLMQGALDVLRSRIGARIGRYLDGQVSPEVYDALVRLPLKARGDGDGMQPLRDLDSVRGFLSSGGPSAFFDLPWMPLYLGLCFFFHFWIGITAIGGTVILVMFALMTEFRVRGPIQAAAGFAKTRTALATAGRRNAEVLRAMGMSGRMTNLWEETNRKYLIANERASDVAGGLGGVSKIFRMILQSAVLGVGAYLVIHQESTAGVIIASSILTSRALAPVELAIANWKGFVAARQAGQRLHKLLTLLPTEPAPMELPTPKDSLAVEYISVAPPGEQRLVLHDIAFSLVHGQGLGIIGPSGSGKSSLVRAIVGVWQPARGKIRIDGAALEQWSSMALGCHIGYLPQDVELFDGTVALNIARLEKKADPRKVLAAAQAAGVHKLILSLPDGYSTVIGEGGTALSAGQRQRIALARALYDEPFLVVLDEPNSNLDAEGEAALQQAMLGVRERGGILIVIAHRPSALAAVDHVLALGGGRAQAFGARDEVLRSVLLSPPQIQAPLKVAADGNGSFR